MIICQLTSPDLKELLQELPMGKFIIVSIVLFVLPSLIYLITIIIKNRALNKLTRTINTSINDLLSINKELASKVTYIYNGVYDEVTLDQLIVIFESATIVDLHQIIKITKRTIVFNHLEDKVKTKANIKSRITNVYNTTLKKLSIFKIKNNCVGLFFKDVWIEDVTAIIYDFVYDEDSKINNNTYNYDILYIRLNEVFKLIQHDFYTTIKSLQ